MVERWRRPHGHVETWLRSDEMQCYCLIPRPRPSSQVSNFSPEKSVLVIKRHKFHTLLEDSSAIIYTLYDHRSRGIPRGGFHKNRVGSDLSVPNIAASIFQKDAELTPQHLGALNLSFGDSSRGCWTSRSLTSPG